MPKKSRGKLSYVKHRYGNKSRVNRQMTINTYSDMASLHPSPGSSTENEALLLLNFAVSCQRDAHSYQQHTESSTDTDKNVSSSSDDFKTAESVVVPFSSNGVK